MAEHACEVCGKPLEYSGRGRPPKRCEEHKNEKNAKAKQEKQEEKMEPSPAPRARPRPGALPPTPEPAPVATQEAPAQRAAPKIPSAGTPDVKSRAKAEAAAKRTVDHLASVDSEAWPRGADGRPMAKVTMTASELIPTGQFANVSVGPAQITHFVDLSRDPENGYFTDAELDTLKAAMNQLAETVERDVIAVQRNIVLESMQEQLSDNGNG